MISFQTFPADASARSPESTSPVDYYESDDNATSDYIQAQDEPRDEERVVQTYPQNELSEAPDESTSIQSKEGGLLALLTKRKDPNASNALLERLVEVSRVRELLMSKADMDRIASAANDAIMDEILETVESEDRRRQSDAAPPTSPVSLTPASPTSYHPYRVMELIDVLDSTTGGIVKLVLTKVRRKAPLSFQLNRNPQRGVQFCRLCATYGDHTTRQHRCRICGISGHHRSSNCQRRHTRANSSNSPTEPFPKPRSKLIFAHYCSLCSRWARHDTIQHQCKICGSVGNHRSRDCEQKPAIVPTEDASASQFCELCRAWRSHKTSEHICRRCSQVGRHRSSDCPDGASDDETDSNSFIGPKSEKQFCELCGKEALHSSKEHLCRVCGQVGDHRSGACPTVEKRRQQWLQSHPAVISYSVDKVLSTLPTPLVAGSLDKISDVETLVKRSMQKMGAWGGGSQTPITTPYSSLIPRRGSGFGFGTSDNGDDEEDVYVLSYAEGRSVVPDRILKIMRLLMHHEVSTNAFDVVVRFDPRPSHWEVERPGMVSPRSLPTSPRLSNQMHQRMDNYTKQTLMGAREKLARLVIEQRRKMRQQQTQPGAE